MLTGTILATSALTVCCGAALAAPATINGGGAASQQFNYAAPDVNGAPVSEFFLFDTLQSATVFGMYWSTTSGAAQTGLINNDLTCIINKSENINGGNCSDTPGGADTVHYAIAESTLTPTQTAAWASSTYGQSAAGNLIQLPMLGTGLAVVVNAPLITANGQAEFTDTDLCGIFSGKITDFSQLQDSPTPFQPGAITVVYRSDSAGTTFLLTNHLSAVCNSSNANVVFTATSTLASLFPSGIVPANFAPVSGLSTLANTLAGLGSTKYPMAVSYISPDWTSVDSATSSAKLSNGQPSPLVVAGLKNGTTFYVPTSANITLGLTHPHSGQNLTPPTTAAAGANPTNWVPVIQTTSTGYPMVGYSTIDLPQCYANPTIAAEMIAFLKDHYNNKKFLAIETNNGLAPPKNSGVAKFVNALGTNILANRHGWNTNLQNPTACAGLVGR